MSIKTLTLAFAAGLLASQAYAKLQQGGSLAFGGSRSSAGDDDASQDPSSVGDADPMGGAYLSLNGGEQLQSENLGGSVFGESPDESTEPVRPNDVNLFGSNASNADRPTVPGIPDLTRGA